MHVPTSYCSLFKCWLEQEPHLSRLLFLASVVYSRPKDTSILGRPSIIMRYRCCTGHLKDHHNTLGRGVGDEEAWIQTYLLGYIAMLGLYHCVYILSRESIWTWNPIIALSTIANVYNWIILLNQTTLLPSSVTTRRCNIHWCVRESCTMITIKPPTATIFVFNILY